MGEKEGYLPYPDEFQTICIHHAEKLTKGANQEKCKFVTPIVVSNFCKGETLGGGSREYERGRLANPTRSVMEHLFTLLNKTKFSLAFSSGMGAISAVLGLLKCGDEILCCEDHYGGTNQILLQMVPRFGIKTNFADFQKIECIKNAITEKTKLFWIENPTNPRLKIADLKLCSELAKQHNIITAVDNSFMTPYLQRPVDLGIDITMQAVTKFMNGHSDVIMGSLSTNNENLYEQLNWIRKIYGDPPSPFDCYQVMRGLKTLPIRMKRHHTNVTKIAAWLEKHPKICGVLQPGLPSHPMHELFKTQASGVTGMISFYVKGGPKEMMEFMSNLKIFCTAVSMGGYESILQPPFYLSHKSFPEKMKEHLGYTPNLIRMAIGIEDPDDLIKDLEQSLAKLNVK